MFKMPSMSGSVSGLIDISFTPNSQRQFALFPSRSSILHGHQWPKHGASMCFSLYGDLEEMFQAMTILTIYALVCH